MNILSTGRGKRRGSDSCSKNFIGCFILSSGSLTEEQSFLGEIFLLFCCLTIIAKTKNNNGICLTKLHKFKLKLFLWGCRRNLFPQHINTMLDKMDMGHGSSTVNCKKKMNQRYLPNNWLYFASTCKHFSNVIIMSSKVFFLLELTYMYFKTLIHSNFYWLTKIWRKLF